MKPLYKFITIALISSIIIAIIWYIYYLRKKRLQTADLEEAPNILKGGKNNPGHLRYTNSQWQGKIYPPTGKKFKFESFDTLEHGIRAWLINARTQLNLGYNTVDSFIDRLTPASENPESARKKMKEEIRQLLVGKETIEVKDLPKIAPIIFRWEANPDFMTAKQEYGPMRILSIAYKYNII